METVRIQNGSTERLYATALDSAGATITGLSDMLVEILRKSDDFYLDFNDNTFKNSGWTTRQPQMTELDATNSAGVYYYDFNTTGFSDDEYFIRVSSATAVNDPMEGELKVGDFVDNIVPASTIADSIWDEDLAGHLGGDKAGQHLEDADATADPSAVADAVWDELATDHVSAGSFGDLTRRILGFNQENYRITSPVYDGSNMTSATLKLYPTATDANNDTNAFATYSVVATYDGDNLLTYKVTKD